MRSTLPVECQTGGIDTKSCGVAFRRDFPLMTVMGLGNEGRTGESLPSSKRTGPRPPGGRSSSRRTFSEKAKVWFDEIPDKLASRKFNLYQATLILMVAAVFYRFVIPMFDRGFE